MIPSIEEIEFAILNYNSFNFRQNLIVFRVTDCSNVVNHECDCLIMSKSGYLTEIEIKRSYSDFIADFKKKHTHNDDKIKEFYYCIHENFYDKALEYLINNGIIPNGIYTYNDECELSYRIGRSKIYDMSKEKNAEIHFMGNGGKKLFLEEQYQLARLGAMRYKNMTQKIIELKKINHEL